MTDDLIEARLRHYGEWLDEATRGFDRGDVRGRSAPPSPNRRRRLVALAAAAAVLVAVGVGTSMALRSDSTHGNVEFGAADQAQAQKWEALAQPPIAHNLPAVVWTGREMIAWGINYPSRFTPPTDGAAYNPTTRTWRKLSPAPDGLAGFTHAAWTGDRVVIVVEPTSDRATTAAATYDPDTDTWELLPPGPITNFGRSSSAWTGDELVIVNSDPYRDYATPGVVALNPSTGRWRELTGLDGYSGLEVTGTLWDGNELLIGGRLACPEPSCVEARPIVIAFDPIVDRAREIALPPTVANRQDSTASPEAATDHDALFSFSTQINSDPSDLFRYDIATGTWSSVPQQECLTDEFFKQATLVGPSGAPFHLWACGANGLLRYDAAHGRFQKFGGPGPFMIQYARGVWTGRDLILWSHAAIAPRGTSIPEVATSRPLESG